MASATKKRSLLTCCGLVALGPVFFVYVVMLPTAKSWGATGQAAPSPRNKIVEHEAVAKTIVDLQQFRQTSSNSIRSDKGVQGTATLVNLNPTINVWYLLKVVWQGGAESTYHLENLHPRSQKLALDSKYPSGIEIVEGSSRHPCALFGGGPPNALDQAKLSKAPYASLCEGRLFLRNPVKGHLTKLEAQAEFFRKQVPGGEQVADVFHHLLEDTHRETAQIRTGDQPGASAATGEDAPLPALLDSQYAGRVLTPGGLGLTLQNVHGGMRPGAWYPASGNPGVYVSVIEPQLIDRAILESHKATVNTLDSVEASSLCYLVAFDLNHFDVGFALGTENPSVEWSKHIQPGMQDPKLPGPDGIGTISPLVATGLISPESASRTVATFTGGFKRMHAAFKYGEFAAKNHGSHYGFVANGVVFSKLQPGLATLFVLDDGSVQMKSWEEQDDRLLARIKDARQNGVPLVEFDARSQATVPGQLVNKWGPGNWSGSEDMRLRTIRAGAGLQSNGKKSFLVYAVFSDATPSAMARVFQAYRFRYGMHLDMNALEHTYLALYRREGAQLYVDYLLQGMKLVDKTDSGGAVPRFLGYPDNRDFFFVMRRNPP
ncbi:MAG TPA: hypothetical protein VMT53_21850 [Terriglobales bacterium]|nr:hypothetical protein [Terriglobales bacterium]